MGDDTLPNAKGKIYKEEFLNEHKDKSFISRIKFSGKVSDEELQNAYSNCDIFVAPSRFESFGLIFLEAMREGKPVIGCLAGGMPEIIKDKVNGILIPPSSKEELAKAIIWLIEHPIERVEMGKKGLQIFEECFTSEKMAVESIKMYELAVNTF